jgi:hypothetical protein
MKEKIDRHKIYRCEFCGADYPYFDKSVRYYCVNVFGCDRIICKDCKIRLKLIK